MSEMPVAEFWEKQLLGKPPLLLLPTDKPRTSAASSLFQVDSWLTHYGAQTTDIASIDRVERPSLEMGSTAVHIYV